MLAIERKLMVIKNELPKTGLVLNLGSAGGNNYQFFPTNPDLKVISLDLDYRPQGLFIQGDALCLPFKAGLFDYAVVLDVLEHIPDDHSAIKEISRVLKENGKLYITTPCSEFDFKMVKLPTKRSSETIFKEWGHVRVGYSINEMNQLVTGDFQILKMERFGATWACIGYQMYYYWRWYRFWKFSPIRWFMRFFIYMDKLYCKGKGTMFFVLAEKKAL